MALFQILPSMMHRRSLLADMVSNGMAVLVQRIRSWFRSFAPGNSVDISLSSLWVCPGFVIVPSQNSSPELRDGFKYAAELKKTLTNP